MEELYKTLGYAKCVELSKKSRTFWEMLKLADTPKNAPVGGVVREGIAKDFIREFLPAGFGLKSGLVFDAENKKTSPQCDAIIYKGVPLLEFTDVVVVEKEQVKAIVVRKRLKEACDSYAVIVRWEPKIEQKRGKEPAFYNFDSSVSRLIEWLRNLS